MAIDQLHRLLRSAGRRNLRTDQIVDRAGNLRVIFRTPNWEDFVHLAFSEIRFYGAENMQIARRLRAGNDCKSYGYTTDATSFCLVQRTRASGSNDREAL
jgi:hypothetical protein